MGRQPHAAADNYFKMIHTTLQECINHVTPLLRQNTLDQLQHFLH